MPPQSVSRLTTSTVPFRCRLSHQICVAAPVLSRDGDWNAAAWSNFIKSYFPEENAKRDEDWNAAAWSNFIKSYFPEEQNSKRDEENWNAAAWSNFIKSYFPEENEIDQQQGEMEELNKE